MLLTPPPLSHTLSSSPSPSPPSHPLEHDILYGRPLCLNTSKTKESIIYKRGGGTCKTPPEVISGAARVTRSKVLGVTLSTNLSMTQHLDETLAICAASMDP